MKRSQKSLLLILLFFLLFAGSACSQEEEKMLFYQADLQEMEVLPQYKVWISKDYLRMELENEGEHLIPLNLLKMAFPTYAEDFALAEGADYIRPQLLDKVPKIKAKLAESSFELGSYSGDQEDFAYVNLKWQEPLGYVFLVNKEYTLDSSYEDQSLRTIKSPFLQPLYYNMRMAGRALENLEAMASDFHAATRKPMILVSTYRDYDYQERIFKNRIASNRANYNISYEEAYARAAEIIAIPGSSEHQSGLAVDFSNKTLVEQGRTLVSDFSKEAEGKWLFENANKYGFILRYPKDKVDITEIIYEPWHYRYTGQPHAQIIFENGWCLEEYHDFLQEEKEILGQDYSVYYLEQEKLLSHEIYYSDQLKIENDNKGGWILSY